MAAVTISLLAHISWTGYDRSMPSHRWIDLRSLARHRLIAEKLKAGPEPVGIALADLDRWTPGAGRSSPYLDEWRRILALPRDEIARMIVEDSERMAALRQCSPFAGVIGPKERWRFNDAFRAGTHNPGLGGDLE